MTTQTPEPRPGEAWLDKMIADEPDARGQFKPGDVFQPHDGETSDLNVHYADLLAGPDESVPDPMAGYTAPDEGDAE
jgi:hypothetical protein